MSHQPGHEPEPELTMTPEPQLRPVGRVLRLPELEHKVGLKKTQIYGLMARDEFPMPIKLTSRAVGWLEFEVDKWIQARVADRVSVSDLRKIDSGA